MFSVSYGIEVLVSGYYLRELRVAMVWQFKGNWMKFNDWRFVGRVGWWKSVGSHQIDSMQFISCLFACRLNRGTTSFRNLREHQVRHTYTDNHKLQKERHSTTQNKRSTKCGRCYVLPRKLSAVQSRCVTLLLISTLTQLETLFNLLKPNDIYICRTAALTSRRYILNIYSTNIHTEYFKHAA